MTNYHVMVSYANIYGDLMNEVSYPKVAAESVQSAIISAITYFLQEPEVVERGYILRGARVVK
jgi:hypothetical protein